MMLHIDDRHGAWFGDQREGELIGIMDDVTSNIYCAQLVRVVSREL
jgi:hypothetical protein